MDLSGAHPSVAAVARYLVVNPNLPEHLRAITYEFEEMAEWLIEHVPSGPELTVCMRKLLEAKDCAVRAALDTPGRATLGALAVQQLRENTGPRP